MLPTFVPIARLTEVARSRCQRLLLAFGVCTIGPNPLFAAYQQNPKIRIKHWSILLLIKKAKKIQYLVGLILY